MQRYLCILLLCAAATALPAQTFTTLASFNGGNGPYVGLLQGLDGDFYGTTYGGGAKGDYGTVFKVAPDGKLTTLHSFTFTDGADPDGALVQATDGTLYGTTSEGGAAGCVNRGCGTVFAISPEGRLTTLHVFSPLHGDAPHGLVEAANGNLYGVTYQGGPASSNTCPTGCGTIFKITPAGDFTTLHKFDVRDGEYPSATLVQAHDGNLYGTTSLGGADLYYGTVFRLAAGGALTTLYSFAGPNEEDPFYGLAQTIDGDFYGTTNGPGTGCTESGFGCGTIFTITPTGTLTTLHTFVGADGATPDGVLLEATDGNLYGTTAQGGASNECLDGCGTIFKLTRGGRLTTLFSFDGSTGTSVGGLMQATDGNFYGTTSFGGTSAAGSVFRFSIGLPPFVKTLPVAGEAGTTVHILGTNLAAPVSVTFNGTPAIVTAVSPSQIIAIVPRGATTGKVAVTTPTGTLLSNTVFQVRQ